MKTARAYHFACVAPIGERMKDDTQRVLDVFVANPDNRTLATPNDEPPDGWLPNSHWRIASHTVAADGEGAIVSLIWEREIQTLDPRQDRTKRHQATLEWAAALFPDVPFDWHDGACTHLRGKVYEPHALLDLHVVTEVKTGLPWAFVNAAGHEYKFKVSNYLDSWMKQSGETDRCAVALGGLARNIRRWCREYCGKREGKPMSELVENRVGMLRWVESACVGEEGP